MSEAPEPEGRGAEWDLDAADGDDRTTVNWRKSLRRGMRRWVKRPLLRLALIVVPRVYTAYCRLVWATSRIVDRGEPLKGWRDESDGIVCGLWHEEVFTVAWAYRDFRPHTLASIGDAGEMITRLLERCDFTVFRGGSARARTRRRTGVIHEMIAHMKETPRVIYGITVDGSMGPRYELKAGVIAIARACGRPVGVVRTWYKRCIRLRTWDRMAIPLPFNVITRDVRGPFWPPETRDEGELEAFRLRVERELLLLAKGSYEELGQRVPEELLARLRRHGAGTADAPFE